MKDSLLLLKFQLEIEEEELTQAIYKFFYAENK